MNQFSTVSIVRQSIFLFVVAISIAACTKSEPEHTNPPAPTVTSATAAKEVLDPNSKADSTLEIASDGDNMAFNKDQLTAKAGGVVKLKFTNTSKSSGLQHNWVLVQPGQEEAVANAGTAAGESSDWVPSGDSKVIAHTKLLRTPGESDSIVFRAPAAGDYPFICTFPGHYMAMKGVFHSKP